MLIGFMVKLMLIIMHREACLWGKTFLLNFKIYCDEKTLGIETRIMRMARTLSLSKYILWIADRKVVNKFLHCILVRRPRSSFLHQEPGPHVLSQSKDEKLLPKLIEEFFPQMSNFDFSHGPLHSVHQAEHFCAGNLWPISKEHWLK